MTTSAGHLRDLLNQWAVPTNEKPEKVRGVGADGDWRGHMRAIDYLRDIDMLLTGVEASGGNVPAFRRSQPRWTAAVFGYWTPWGSTNSARRRCINTDDLNMLDALDTFLSDFVSDTEASDTERDQLTTSLANARQALLDDTDLPRDMRRYLLGLVGEAEACLVEYDTFGNVSMRQVTLQLGGALMTAAAIVSDASQRRTFADLANKILLPMGNLGVAAATFIVEITNS